jgi:hypothetical protein
VRHRLIWMGGAGPQAHAGLLRRLSTPSLALARACACGYWRRRLVSAPASALAPVRSSGVVGAPAACGPAAGWLPSGLKELLLSILGWLRCFNFNFCLLYCTVYCTVVTVVQYMVLVRTEIYCRTYMCTQQQTADSSSGSRARARAHSTPQVTSSAG